jgi:MoxR-like ATPase
MIFDFYKNERKCCEKPVALDIPNHNYFTDPKQYQADEGLKNACNIAIFLQQPLLLTGEPGSGKTQFAHNLACELGLGKALEFETKSTSVARDLFYTYDAIKRFHQAQIGGQDVPVVEFIEYQALGEAIIRSKKRTEVEKYLNNRFEEDNQTAYERRSVVLIDEIDKAPRDFPNDILNELERKFFRIPEFDNKKIEANEDYLPIVIITSNSEKELPDAFLRRCIYYHIPFPDRERLHDIVTGRLGTHMPVSSFLADALDLFFRIRDSGYLQKKPATAELLGWVVVLHNIGKGKAHPMTDLAVLQQTLPTLIKAKQDQPNVADIVQQWHKEWQANQNRQG